MPTEVSVEQLSKFNPLSSLNCNAIKQAAESVQMKVLTAGSTLFKKGSLDDKSYYLLEGCIDLIGDSGVLKSIEAHSSDATNPIIQITPRTATAIAQTDSILIMIESDILDMLLTWDQTSTYQVKELKSGSNNESDDWMLQLLRTEAFHRIPPANIQLIFSKIENVNTTPGQQIITQGDVGDYFYIIKSGRCLVTRATANQPKGIKLAELTDGDTFGEEALISASKRNTTITMLTNGTLCRLSKSDFLELLNEPSLEKFDFPDAQQLVDSGIAIWIDARLPSEFNNHHIKESVNIPLISLRLKISKMKTNMQYIVYCDSERRSSVASFILTEAGFSAGVLRDGLKSVAESYQNINS